MPTSSASGAIFLLKHALVLSVTVAVSSCYGFVFMNVNCAALCNDGVLAVTNTTETINADTYDFVRWELLPRMNPLDGSSSKSIAVMDNCAVHHVLIVEDLFAQAGVLLLWVYHLIAQNSIQWRRHSVLSRHT